jgi:RHS repeat-associated protein
LGRVQRLLYPRDVQNNRRELRVSYNRAGAFEQMWLGPDLYVQHIAYNAKGQRTLISYGNGTMTRYAYEPRTFRLVRLRSEGFTSAAPYSYQPSGGVLQDLGYDSDLTGNIVSIRDRTPDSGIASAPAGMDTLDRTFVYDAIYRLLSASGREITQPPANSPWEDSPKSTDHTIARGYLESYDYDEVNNLAQLSHSAGSDLLTRIFGVSANSNRLTSLMMGQVAFAYGYDANGNMTREGDQRNFSWDALDRLIVFRQQATGAQPLSHSHFLYDSTHQRIKKFSVRIDGSAATVTCIDGLLEHYVENGSENNALHVMDGQNRIATIRVGAAFADDSSPARKFILSDHLGSSNVTVSEMAAVLDREEFTPFGDTSFGGYPRKRWRYAGKETDDDSGLVNYGARHYSRLMCRWTNCDPAGAVDGPNLYAFVQNNPVRLRDVGGKQSAPASSNVLQQWTIWDTIKFELESKARLYYYVAFPEGAHAPTATDVGNYFKGAGTGALEAFSPASIVLPGPHTEMFEKGRTLFRTVLSLGTAYRPRGGPRHQFAPATSGGYSRSPSHTAIDPLRGWNSLLLQMGNQGQSSQSLSCDMCNRPDVFVGALKRWRVTAGSTSRGITDKIRAQIKAWAAKYGTMDGPPESGPVHAGHAWGKEHFQTLPGEETIVGAQTARGNLQQAPTEAKAAASRRAWNAAHPNDPPLPVRDKAK